MKLFNRKNRAYTEVLLVVSVLLLFFIIRYLLSFYYVNNRWIGLNAVNSLIIDIIFSIVCFFLTFYIFFLGIFIIYQGFCIELKERGIDDEN